MASRPWHYVAASAQLADLCGHLAAVRDFAIDTEFVTEDTFHPVLCLIQVATGERLALIDAMALGDLRPFWSLVAAPDNSVVAHASAAEIRFCQTSVGAAPAALFDVQIAAGFAGYGFPQSHTTLVRRVLGRDVRGGETRTDWRRRPLAQRQIEYALEDVRYLAALRDALQSELRERGRLEWAEDEFRAHCQSCAEVRPLESWRRVKANASLNRRQLAVLRELAEWRDREAALRNRPLRSVATDDVLRELARRHPANEHDLLLFRGMNRRNLRRVSDDLLAAVRRGLEVPEHQCPELPPKPDDSPRVRLLTSLLSAALASRCAQEALPAALVATTEDLSHLVRGFLATGTLRPDSPLASGWRHDICGRPFLELLQGKRALRVTDATAQFPVSIE